MPVLRQHHTQDFTVIPNALLWDQRLSCRDRGLLVWMLSKPRDWKFTKKSIIAEMEQDGERSIQAGVTKLQETGYLVITRETRVKGKLAETIWNVYDTPQLQNAVMEQEPIGSPECGSPQLRYPAMQNAVVLKKNYITKEKAAPGLEAGEQPVEQYEIPEF